MRRADVEVLLDHLYQARDRVLRAADDPGVPITRPDPLGTRDLRAILVHELDVEWSWRERLQGEDRTRFSPDERELDPADLPDVAAIRARWSLEELAMRRWVAGLTDADLDGPCGAETSGSHPLWFHLLHLYSHAMAQLADAAAELTRVGRSPGELDFLRFAPSGPPAPDGRAALADELVRSEHALAARDPVGIAGGFLALLADGFREFGSSGRVWTREAMARALALSEPSVAPVAIEDVEVTRLSDDVALVTFVAGGSNRSSIWILRAGRWRLRFHQGTRRATAD